MHVVHDRLQLISCRRPSTEGDERAADHFEPRRCDRRRPESRRRRASDGAPVAPASARRCPSISSAAGIGDQRARLSGAGRARSLWIPRRLSRCRRRRARGRLHPADAGNGRRMIVPCMRLGLSAIPRPSHGAQPWRALRCSRHGRRNGGQSHNVDTSAHALTCGRQTRDSDKRTSGPSRR